MGESSNRSQFNETVFAFISVKIWCCDCHSLPPSVPTALRNCTVRISTAQQTPCTMYIFHKISSIFFTLGTIHILRNHLQGVRKWPFLLKFTKYCLHADIGGGGSEKIEKYSDVIQGWPQSSCSILPPRSFDAFNTSHPARLISSLKGEGDKLVI